MIARRQRPAGTGGAEVRLAEHDLPRRRSPSSTPTSTGSRPRASTSRSTRSSARSSRRWARPTSTTSTSSAGRSRSGSRPTRSSGSSPTTSAGWRSATAPGTMLPLGTLATITREARPADHHPVQPLPVVVDHRRGGGRVQLGPGAQADGADGRRELPAGDGLRVDRDVVPGEEGRQPGALRLRAGGPAGLPRPGRPVRELADPGRGDPGRPPGPAGHGGRGGDPGDGQQHLHPDRHRADHRPGEQERDPDRRVRPRAPGQGRGHHRRRR